MKTTHALRAIVLATGVMASAESSLLAQDTDTQTTATDTQSRNSSDRSSNWGWLGLLGLTGLYGLRNAKRNEGSDRGYNAARS